MVMVVHCDFSIRDCWVKVYILLFSQFVMLVQGEPLRYNKDLSKDVTTILDQLLREDKYDKRFRPNFGGDPVEVEINIYIKSMGPVLETEEVFSTDLYLRHNWYDKRLQFNLTSLQEFSLNWLFLEKVWTPDTYILNGVSGTKLHTITVPNKFLRLRNDGFLTYSMRYWDWKKYVNVRMRYSSLMLPSINFTFTHFALNGYSQLDMKYKWSSFPVKFEPGVNLAQYDVVDTVTKEEVVWSNRRDYASVISVEFHLRRHTGYFILQVYVPCTLIVFCSWVSFWIDPGAVPARVSLGVTTVLSLTTLGFGGRSQMPKTSYATALDWFVILCFGFVFSSMVEYACINYIDKVSLGVSNKSENKKEKPNTKHKEKFYYKNIFGWMIWKLSNPWEFGKSSGKFSAIDIYSRKLFPITFGLFNLVYWIAYSYFIGNESPAQTSKFQ